MQQNKTYKAVGLFVVIGFLCLFGIIFNYVGKQFFMPEEDLVVMYFEEPINGLSVGSPVLLQGMEIGRVEKIQMIANLSKGTFKIPVYVLFTGKNISAYEDEDDTGDDLLNDLIKNGLRARLSSASLLTGQLNIELIMDPKQPAVMRGDGKMYEIPTILSPYAKISKDLDEIPLQESFIRIGNLVVELDEKLPILLNNIDGISSKIDNMLDKKSGEVSKTLNNINATMEVISKAGLSIKNLTDYLERHPESVIKGKRKGK